MDNSLPTSNCQAIGESISEYVQQEERAGLEEEAGTKQTTMTTNPEANKENDDQEIITRVENIAASTAIDKTINENSVTSELRDSESEAGKKPSKDRDGGTIKLMQDAKESEIDFEDESRITNDETKISNTWTNDERGRAKKSICWTIFCGSKNSMIRHERHSTITRERSRSRRRRRRSTMKVRKNPIPTKEWEWIYRRRLVRQNAFCDIWPENL